MAIEDEVETLISFAGALGFPAPLPHIARRFIKDANGDVNRAFANFEADPNRYDAEKYDEDLFSQDRDGGSTQLAGVPSFQIDHADDDAAQYPHSTAATRPNTRPNTPSNSLHGSGMGDYYSQGANQESGVVGGAGVQFGPATREYYESNQWAMTTVSNASPDPPPDQRRRNQGEPAFLKPSQTLDYLPALLTILANIPMARNALLMKSHILSNYGENSSWWSGNAAALSGNVVNGQPSPGPSDRLIHEAQRIIAFLDATERAYGSAEGFIQLEWFVHSTWANEEKDAIKFLGSWLAAAERLEPSDGFSELFKTTAHQVQNGNSKYPNIWCLTPVLDNGGSGPCLSLYDVLDDTIWSDDPDGTKDVDAAIDRVAEVLVIIVKQPDVSANGLNMTIPESWYADRYLTAYESKSKQMRKDRAEYRGKIAEIQQKLQKYTRFNYQGKTGDALVLLETAMSAFRPSRRRSVQDDGDVVMATTDNDSSPDDKVLKQLQTVYDNVKVKIEDLKKEEQMAQQSLEQLSGLLKEHSTTSELNPTSKYQLCGLSTDPSVFYIKQNCGIKTSENVNQDLEAGQNADSATDCWWRIQYDNSGQISKSRIAQTEALTAAAVENREVLLVYASEKALSQPLEELPQALADFVATDNAAYGKELAGETEQPPPYELDGAGDSANADNKEQTDRTEAADTVMDEAGAKTSAQHIEFVDNSSS
ncbi:hypothetical protein IWZ01DRAFT_490039 [Phyllosticta capitalensis]